MKEETQDLQDNQDTQDTQDTHLRDAKKFLGLIEAFETEADGLEENLVKEKEEIAQSLEIIDEVPEDLNTSLIESDEYMKDFNLVKQALRDDIKTTREILNKLGADIKGTHSDDISGSVLMAYAELKKGNVTSMKLLMDSYSTVAETQLKIKKLITEIKSFSENEESTTLNIQNNFVGSASEILEKLKK